MKLTLNNEDLIALDKLIKSTVFEHAYPFYQFFTNKIAQVQKQEAELQTKLTTEKVEN